jgi:AcrR family transcriptional regulator
MEGNVAQVRTERPRVSRERILEAAVRLMDAEGLEAVTMRRLGRELGVEAMSLYNHVEGKDDIRVGMLERVLSELELPEEGSSEDLMERVRDMARSFRILLHDHPNAVPLFTEHRGPMSDPDALRVIEVALRTLRGAGLSPEDTVHAYGTLVGFVLGYVALEVGALWGDPLAHEGWTERIAASVDPAVFPTLVEMLPHMFVDCDREAEFEYGLDTIISGLRAKLAS